MEPSYSQDSTKTILMERFQPSILVSPRLVESIGNFDVLWMGFFVWYVYWDTDVIGYYVVFDESVSKWPSNISRFRIFISLLSIILLHRLKKITYFSISWCNFRCFHKPCLTLVSQSLDEHFDISLFRRFVDVKSLVVPGKNTAVC